MSKNLKILIIEDESRIAKRIERMINNILKEEVQISYRATLQEGKSFLKDNPIDLLFLDLNLNGEDGFGVLKRFVNPSFHTIIVSAYKDQALRAFEYGVLDFIAKPFSEDRLTEAFARINQNDDENKSVRYIAVNKKGSKRLVPVSSITHINGADIYSEIHCVNGSTYLHNVTLDHMMDILPSEFERIHRSHIANMNIALETFSEPGSRYYLRLDNGLHLPIGRTKIKAVKEKWFVSK